MQFLEAQEYSMFSRIVFDTAPTVIMIYNVVSRVDSRYPIAISSVISFPCWQGHTLRLLSLPDFLDASIGKILKVLLASLF